MDSVWGITAPMGAEDRSDWSRLTLQHIQGRRHDFTYLAVDLFTDRALAELEMRGVSMSWQVRKPGQLSGTVMVPALPNSRHYFDATIPGRTALYVIRDGEPIWGGIIWKRSFGSDSRELNIEADTWDSYMYHRILDEDFMFLRDPIDYGSSVPQREGVEQIEVFRVLWRHMSAHAGSDIGVVLGDQTSDVKRGESFRKWDFETYGQHLESFSDKTNGYEWVSTVGMDRFTGRVQRRIDFAAPKFGRSWQENGLVWEYPGSGLEYTWEGNSDEAATHMFVIGKGEGDTAAYKLRGNDAAMRLGFPRLDKKEDHKTVFDGDVLWSHAAKYLMAYEPPLGNVTLRMHPRIPVPMGRYFLGDEVRVLIDDEFFALAGISDEDLVLRIKGLKLTPGDDGLEQIDPELVIARRDIKIVDPEDEESDLKGDDWGGPTVDAPDVIPDPTQKPDDTDSGSDDALRRAAVRSRLYGGSSWHRGSRVVSGNRWLEVRP